MFPNAPNGQLKIHLQTIGLHGNEAEGIFYNEAKEFLLFLWEQRKENIYVIEYINFMWGVLLILKAHASRLHFPHSSKFLTKYTLTIILTYLIYVVL